MERFHVYGVTGFLGTGKPKIQPMIHMAEPEKKNPGQMTTQDLKKLQADANRRQILLPTSFNRKIQ